MQRVLIAIASICYIIVILLASIGIVVISPSIHKPFLGNSDLVSVDQTISKYLIKQDMNIIKDFRVEEQSHLRDVASLINKGLFLLAGLIAILGFLVFNASDKEKHTILMAPFAFLIIFFIPMLIMFSHFSSSFMGFHKLFFPQGNFQFPVNSILIMTYPETFFITMGVIITEIFLLIASIKIFGYIGIKKLINNYNKHYHQSIKDNKKRIVENENHIQIRQAIPKEARSIKKVLMKAIIKTDSRKQLGLLEYAPPNIAQIEIAIKEEQPIYVAIKNNKVIAALLCYNKDFLSTYFADEQIEKFLIKRFDKFHHIDALAVLDNYRKQGIAKQLLDRLFLDLSHHPDESLLFGAILHQPRQLDIQVHIMRSNGFFHKGNLFIDDETAFGIYMKTLPFTQLEVGLSWFKSLFNFLKKKEINIEKIKNK